MTSKNVNALKKVLKCYKFPSASIAMADTIELFLVGQGLLLITFLAMVGLFLLLLFIRTHSGAGRGGGGE